MIPVKPQGDYALVRRVDRLIFTAGFTPRQNESLVYNGVLGVDRTDSEAREAAALATQRTLKALLEVVGSDSGLQIEDLVVFVRACDSYTALSVVGDAASAVIRDELGQSEPPCRAVIGVSTLPGGALVEVKMTASVP